MTEAELKEGILFAMENPLLDVLSNVNTDFLSKYGLEPDGTIMVDDSESTELMVKVLADVTTNFECEQLAGGSAQNTLRIFQVNNKGLQFDM